jgi:hypothetical protein
MIKNFFAPGIGVSKGKSCPKCLKVFGARTLAIHLMNCTAKPLVVDDKKGDDLKHYRESSGSRERRQTLPPKSAKTIFKEEDLMVTNTYESSGSSVDAKRFSFGLPQEL